MNTTVIARAESAAYDNHAKPEGKLAWQIRMALNLYAESGGGGDTAAIQEAVAATIDAVLTARRPEGPVTEQEVRDRIALINATWRRDRFILNLTQAGDEYHLTQPGPFGVNQRGSLDDILRALIGVEVRERERDRARGRREAAR